MAHRGHDCKSKAMVLLKLEYRSVGVSGITYTVLRFLVQPTLVFLILGSVLSSDDTCIP